MTVFHGKSSVCSIRMRRGPESKCGRASVWEVCDEEYGMTASAADEGN